MKKHHTTHSTRSVLSTRTTGRRGTPLDPGRYTELGQFIAARLERLDLRLVEAVAKVKGIDPEDTDRAKSFAGGAGSHVLRGLKSLSDEDAEKWARVLKLEPREKGHFLFLADVQRLAVAAPYTKAAQRLRDRIRWLEEKLADAKAARRGLPTPGGEPEVIQSPEP